MERSGWDHSMHVRAAGGPGTQPTTRSAAQLLAWASHLLSKRPGGPREQLRRTQAGAGQKASVTATLSSLARGQGGNLLIHHQERERVGERSDPEVTLRIYFISPRVVSVSDSRRKSQSCLGSSEHVQPQPVRSGLRVSEISVLPEPLQPGQPHTPSLPGSLSPAVGCLCSFTFQQLGSCQKATPGPLAAMATRGHLQ